MMTPYAFGTLWFLFSAAVPEPAGDAWLVWDYSKRITLIALLFAFPSVRDALKGERLTFQRSDVESILVLAGITILAFMTIYQVLWDVMPWAHNPLRRVENSVLHALDVVLGCALVALVEELVFTMLAMKALGRFPPAAAVLVSAFLFGLIHWARGPANAIVAFATHIPYLIDYRRRHSFATVVAAHWLTDAVLFL